MTYPTPVERRFLDLMNRIDRDHTDRLSALQARIEALETVNRTSEQEIELIRQELLASEALIQRQSSALASLNSTLARFLAPPELPPFSPVSPGN
jgi:chromosome segregation ATPase